MPLTRKLQVGLVLLAIAALPGCSNSDLSSATAQQLRGLAKAYLDFAVARGMGPADQAELTRCLRQVPPGMLSIAGSESPPPQDFFVSPRDGQPLQIHYKIPVAQITKRNAPLVACETTGKDSRCLAVYANGQVVCVAQPIPTEWQTHDN